jgi:GntP family gluconate:H+ symporter
MNHSTSLLLYTLLAVVGLIVLVSRFRLNSFIALVLASLFVGVCSGMKLPEIAKGFQEGVGSTLGFIAVVVGLGTMLGKMLAESGGAEVVAESFIRVFGQRQLHWVLAVIGFIVGLPVFFGVGLVLLVPLLFALCRDSKAPLLFLGLPLVAGLSASHGLVPPHPGPIVAIEKLGADTGRTIFFSLLIGFPTALIAGPLIVRLLTRRVAVEAGGIGATLARGARRGTRPGFALTLFTILLPVLLMMLATLADLKLPKESAARGWLDFVGAPLISMLIAVLFSFYSLGKACGFGGKEILKFTEDCVGPAASILLVVGAGGGFSRILVLGGVDTAIADAAKGMSLSPLLLGWLVAALIRVAVGSATVAITLAASILAPIAAATPGTHRELLVLALGAGSLIASHVNDGGFWFVKEYFNMTVSQTLRTWTVVETTISVVALVLILGVNTVVSSGATPPAAGAPAPVKSARSAEPSILPPGVAIAHSPASSGIYLGSPGIAILTNGIYLAKCDEFGPASAEYTKPVTRIFRSGDRGQTWTQVTVVTGVYWASLFEHRGAAWMLGTDRHDGRVLILRSTDEGVSWTTPSDARSGILRPEPVYHCAPVPVILHGGRIWRAMEDTQGARQGNWANPLRPFMMSAPADADLLNAANWTFSPSLNSDPAWLGGKFGGWLEGNAVATPDGGIADMLRVDFRNDNEKAALVRISSDGKQAAFDPLRDVVSFPGGCKKFTVRFDPVSRRYWSLANFIPARHRGGNQERMRNTLALTSSTDLTDWTVRAVVLYRPDPAKHAFQYVDWLFDGNDIVAAARTAHEDGLGGAASQHDANFITFHRIAGFRELNSGEQLPER